MNHAKLLLIAILAVLQSSAQNIGINSTGASPDATAMLDIDANDKGLLIPRIALTGSSDVTTIAGATTSLMIYNTATTSDVTPGFYYWDGSAWQRFAELSAIDEWSVTGNSGTTNGVNFLGTIDSIDVDIRTNNLVRVRITTKGQIELLNCGESVFIGEAAGASDDLTNNHNNFIGFYTGEYNINGYRNDALGTEALRFNTTGSYNTAIGYGTMRSNTTCFNSVAYGALALYSQDYTNGGVNWASGNTAIGFRSMYYTNSTNGTNGTRNTGVGYYTLNENTTGTWNTSVGYVSMQYNTTGSRNTAFGSVSLYENTTGSNNTAVGNDAARYNTTGINNTALGMYTFRTNTTGSYNTALGSYALYTSDGGEGSVGVGHRALNFATSADYNTSVGFLSSYLTTTGSDNAVVGANALYSNTTGSENCAVGSASMFANTTGSQNTAIGYGAFSGATAFTNSTAVGANSVVTASNQVRLGSATVTDIGGYAAWSNISDGRFKSEVTQNVPGLSFVLNLEPVTYRLERDKLISFLSDSVGTSVENNKSEVMTGFIAQDVESLADSLGFDFNGVHSPDNPADPYALRYAMFVVPLVKSVQEQQIIIEELLERIDALEKQVGGDQ